LYFLSFHLPLKEGQTIKGPTERGEMEGKKKQRPSERRVNGRKDNTMAIRKKGKWKDRQYNGHLKEGKWKDRQHNGHQKEG
jgi:hypothetical protein